MALAAYNQVVVTLSLITIAALLAYNTYNQGLNGTVYAGPSDVVSIDIDNTQLVKRNYKDVVDYSDKEDKWMATSPSSSENGKDKTDDSVIESLISDPGYLDAREGLPSTHNRSKTAQITEDQKFYGTLLILAAQPQDLVYPYTRRFDNSTDPGSMLQRRWYFGMRGYDRNIPTASLLDDCPHDCQFTIDTSRYSEADVVLMYSQGTVTNTKDAWVKRLRPEQMFAFFYYEQPHHFSDRMLKFYNERVGFNWTMHYQQDATFSWPYGRAIRKNKPLPEIKKNFAENKTRTVVWVVSRCSTPVYQHREHYVAELTKYIDVDIFGSCTSNGTGKEKLSFKNLFSKYKFVISFENADCDDYITEKFYQNIQFGVVPLVLGRRAKYNLHAPPNSYIQADAFDSPKHLAAYLRLLDKNDDLYNRYHKWRSEFDVQFYPLSMCETCRRMRDMYYKPAKIDMTKYLSVNTRCWAYTRSQLPDWKQRVQNVSFEDPWATIRKNNAKGRPLRFR